MKIKDTEKLLQFLNDSANDNRVVTEMCLNDCLDTLIIQAEGYDSVKDYSDAELLDFFKAVHRYNNRVFNSSEFDVIKLDNDQKFVSGDEVALVFRPKARMTVKQFISNINIDLEEFVDCGIYYITVE